MTVYNVCKNPITTRGHYTMAAEDPTGGASPFETLTPRQRRRLVAGASLRAIATTALVVTIYFLIPMDRTLTPATVIGIALGALAFIAIVGWQVWNITRSDHPTFRAVEALALIIPLYVLLFASGYYLVNHTDMATFGEPVTRVDAMYFSATVFTTVGFGDITAKTQGARVIVTVQMMLDLVIIGLVVRLVINAVKVGQRHQNSTT
jgi:voltage-gated potassium channel